MTRSDQQHWDARYADDGLAPILDPPPPPPLFADVSDLFPTSGTALELACGRGRGAVWLASRGMSYVGVDVSPVAIDLARRLVDSSGLTHRCRFEAFDLDNGMPPADPVDLVLSHLYFDRRLAPAMIDRVKPGGLLAIATLSEVGAGSGEYRAAPGELRRMFGDVDILADDEADGFAWLIGRTVAQDRA